VCHAVRAPGSNATRPATIRIGACGVMIGSCQTVPVKLSVGPRRVGLEPALKISITHLPVSIGGPVGPDYFFNAA
jgi:hypothetical protein